MDILILAPIQHNRLPHCAPRGQELIFLWSTCCSGLSRPRKLRWRREVREYVTPPSSTNRRTPPLHMHSHTAKPTYHTLLCSFWVSTDKQCDDQRPTIALSGRAERKREGGGGEGGDKDWSVSGKDWKRPGLSTLEMEMKRGKHIRTKPCSLLAVA